MTEQEAVKEAAEKLASGQYDNVAVVPKGDGFEVVVKQPSGPEVGDGSWPAKPRD